MARLCLFAAFCRGTLDAYDRSGLTFVARGQARQTENKHIFLIRIRAKDFRNLSVIGHVAAWTFDRD